MTPTPAPTPTPFSSRASLTEAHRVLAVLLADPALIAQIDTAAATLARTIRTGNKVLAIGNGGSMCDAAHFAEELTGRFRADRRPLPALAGNDPGHLTCTANDYGFEFVFSRWVEALGQPGDALIILSTSGNSPNCLKAAHTAKAKGLHTIALLGKQGGQLAPLAHTPIIAPGTTSDRIQELHMLILHIFVEAIEASL
ncbi:MAG TPA: SIS domain-containing protein [Phycisphaerales bacterium]|nr:SIS domain-containing protein [Phycisphaerales bacterium]